MEIIKEMPSLLSQESLVLKLAALLLLGMLMVLEITAMTQISKTPLELAKK
jgi:hypothetical protein